MAQTEFDNSGNDVLEWIKIREEIGASTEDFHVETGTEKLLRKIKENPLVPIGALATIGCLGYGLYSFRKGERRMSQMMMRARVVSQGFTVIALVGGIVMAARKTVMIKKE